MIAIQNNPASLLKEIESGGRKGILVLTYLFISLHCLAAAPALNYTLKPPTNCFATGVECVAFMTWDLPDSLGNLPPGLLGYRIYKNGSFHTYLPNPVDSLYYDFTDPGIFLYSVTAWYDLSPYGFPGQYGESSACEMDTINLEFCYRILPFLEYWNSGDFVFNNWKFKESQGNWDINIIEGNPLPACTFMGIPAQTNYSYMMYAGMFWGIGFLCADFTCSFDYKLEDIEASGTEHLEVGIIVNDTVYPADTITNDGSSGWITHVVDIDFAAGHAFQVYFRAFGENSSKINRWMIDNIVVDVVCRSVIDLESTVAGDLVNLTWNHPCDTGKYKGSVPSGYNIYRTDETGQPPFVRLNPVPVPERLYTDTVPSVAQGVLYQYIITAVFTIDPNSTWNCESPGDTIQVIPVGLENSKTRGSVQVTPNPGTGIFGVRFPGDAESLEIISPTGIVVLKKNLQAGPGAATVDISEYPGGVYFLCVKTHSGTIVRKIIKI